MKNWQKERNYRKKVNADGTINFFIIVNGINVEVSEEIYHIYSSSERQLEYMERDLKRNRALPDASGLPILLPEREVSLEWLISKKWVFASELPPPDEEVILQIDNNTLYQCLGLLSSDEKALIEALFFEDMKEREYATIAGVSQVAIHKRKKRILAKLKNLIEF